MADQIDIVLTLEADPGDVQEFEMSIPVDLLYYGFKVSFLATEALEELLFSLLRKSVAIKTNGGSHSLEELLLSLPADGISVRSDTYALQICRTSR
jgi:hypothetical protein